MPAGSLPPDDAILTGPEFVAAVLVPLAACDALAGRVRTRDRVAAVGRTGFTRCDYAGHPIRDERGFRLLVETPNCEEWLEADAEIDASGVYNSPVAIGAGGAPGERAPLGEIHSRSRRHRKPFPHACRKACAPGRPRPFRRQRDRALRGVGRGVARDSRRLGHPIFESAAVRRSSMRPASRTPSNCGGSQ